MDHSEMIEAYLEYLRRKSARKTTMRLRRVVLTLLNQDLQRGVGETDKDELELWLHAERQPAWTDNTRATYYRAIKSAYKFWSNPRDPWINYDPTQDMDRVPGRPGEARDVTDEELRTILTRAAEPFRLWALIAAYQGLRCCEIAGLDREHITADRLHVVEGKGGYPRVHDTDPDVWAAVRDLPAGPIARNRHGGRTTAAMVSERSNRHFQRDLGLAGVTMHRLRHWLGVRTQRVGKDPRVTMAVLGHRSLSSTQIYTRATDEQQRATRSLLPRLAG